MSGESLCCSLHNYNSNAPRARRAAAPTFLVGTNRDRLFSVHPLPPLLPTDGALSALDPFERRRRCSAGHPSVVPACGDFAAALDHPRLVLPPPLLFRPTTGQQIQVVLACGAFAAALDHPRMLLPPIPSLLLHHREGDPSTVMGGGTSPEQTFSKICEGDVSSVGTFPVPANAVDLVHLSAAEDTEVPPNARAHVSFGSPGGQGGGQCEAVGGGDIDDSGASGAPGDRNRATFRKS